MKSISVIWLFLMGIVGCSNNPAGKFGTYLGYYGGGYPNYFIPKDFPTERWMVDAPQSAALKAQYRHFIETSRLPQVEAMRQENLQRAYEDLMMLGFAGGYIEMTYRGMPGHQHEGGFGPRSTFDRVFTGKPHEMIRLVFPKPDEKWP